MRTSKKLGAMLVICSLCYGLFAVEQMSLFSFSSTAEVARLKNEKDATFWCPHCERYVFVHHNCPKSK